MLFRRRWQSPDLPAHGQHANAADGGVRDDKAQRQWVTGLPNRLRTKARGIFVELNYVRRPRLIGSGDIQVAIGVGGQAIGSVYEILID
jgi:hypothetical protein